MNPRPLYNVSLVIPTYNSENSIITEVNECVKILKQNTAKYDVFIADDKSTDSTSQLLLKNYKSDSHFNIILNRKNIGTSKNKKKLYEKADFDYILSYEANGCWSPQDIEKLIVKCSQTKSDVVIGFRKQKKGYSAYKKFISYMYNFFPSLLFGVKTIDAGGIKIFKKSLYHNKLVSAGAFFEAEMIIRAAKMGKKISFVPVSFRKTPKAGSGKFGSLTIAVQDVIKLWFGGL